MTRDLPLGYAPRLCEKTNDGNHRYHVAQSRWTRHISIRGLLVLTVCAVMGLFAWSTEKDWSFGALAAISLAVMLGLAAQVRDLRRGDGTGFSTSENRWGWRFAVAWRLAITSLVVACFLARFLVTWKVLSFDDGPNLVMIPWQEIYEALLLVCLIVAIASSPRFAAKAGERPWSWPVRLLAWVAAGLSCVILLKDYVMIPALVHITIAGIQASFPARFSADVLATSDPKQLVWFVRITTLGVAAILVSCGLLRLVSVRWWQGVQQRVCLGAIFGVSLAITIVLAGRIVLVEVPSITPILAAQTYMPSLHRLVGGAVLALLLVSTGARKWSTPPLAEPAIGSESWRRDESRYYHERRLVALLLAGVVSTSFILAMKGLLFLYFRLPVDSWSDWSNMIVWCCGSWIGCLTLVLVALAARSFFSGRSDYSDAISIDQPRLSIGLFSLVWMGLLTIVVLAVPVLAAWGFALCLRPM